MSGTAISGARAGDGPALVAMINQIAANEAHHPRDRAVSEIAAHLRACWAPAMRADRSAYLRAGGPGRTPLAAEAAAELAATTTRSPPA